MIRENKIFISVTCDPLFFLFVNCVRDAPVNTVGHLWVLGVLMAGLRGRCHLKERYAPGGSGGN